MDKVKFSVWSLTEEGVCQVCCKHLLVSLTLWDLYQKWAASSLRKLGYLYLFNIIDFISTQSRVGCSPSRQNLTLPRSGSTQIDHKWSDCQQVLETYRPTLSGTTTTYCTAVFWPYFAFGDALGHRLKYVLTSGRIEMTTLRSDPSFIMGTVITTWVRFGNDCSRGEKRKTLTFGGDNRKWGVDPTLLLLRNIK